MLDQIKTHKAADGYKKTLSYLWDDTPATIFYLQQIQIYKRWAEIFNWLVVNERRGQSK